MFSNREVLLDLLATMPRFYMYEYKEDPVGGKVLEAKKSCDKVSCTRGLKMTGEKVNKFNVNLSSVNILDSDNQYEVHLLVPGFKKEQLSIEVEGKRLYLKARNEGHKEDSTTTIFTKSEYSINYFERMVELPDNLDTENIKAVYESGILIVTLNKLEPKVNKITIL